MYVLTGTITLVTAWINWRWRDQQGIALLAGAMLSLSAWAYFNAAEAFSLQTAVKQAWAILENLAVGAFVNLIFLFVITYYGLGRWLTRAGHWILWLPLAGYLFLELTNPWHHLIWSGFSPGPAGSNLLIYQHGALYGVSLTFEGVLIGLTIAILVHTAATARGWDRYRAIWMGVSLTVPLAAAILYALGSQNPISIDFLPIGAAVCSLMSSWIVFEDLQNRVVERTAELQASVHRLEAEIENRQQLENKLRSSQDSLAQRLADQSHNLAGLYDLILINSKSSSVPDLLKQSLEKIRLLLDSQAIGFYQPSQTSLVLEAHAGLPDSARNELFILPGDWLPDGPDVRADLDVAASPDLPVKIARSGYRACLSKQVNLQGKALGMVGAFWQEPRNFGVDEIALFGAVTDELGVILENARFRQKIADTATMQERRRLARDLHDSVTQSLHSLVISSETASRLVQTHPERLEQVLSHLAASARQALKEMRLLLYELRLVPLEEIHFVEAIRTRLEAVEGRANVAVEFEVDPEASWPQAWELEMYPIAMESLNNALKHSRATRVQVLLQAQAETLEMEIRDNGCGFDPQAIPPGGMGLHTMAERAHHLGGCLVVRSAVGQGTSIRLSVPRK